MNLYKFEPVLTSKSCPISWQWPEVNFSLIWATTRKRKESCPFQLQIKEMNLAKQKALRQGDRN